jgi:2-deoxy-D-gluconate 3-dehydrogenase
MLSDRVAIVTGASRGLGRAATRALVAEGVRVLAVARTTADLATLADETPQRIEVVECDMRRAQDIAMLPDRALERFGRLDVVINNAGIAPAIPFLEQTWDAWNEVLTVNVTAMAMLSQAAGRHLVSQGSGKIVNIASTSGLRGKATLVAYSTSKGAVIRFTEALAAEWARHNVQVNAIAPGAFETEAQRAVWSSPDLLEKRLRKIPAHRLGVIEEIGPLVCLLASAASDFITGSTFVIDGGEVSKL